MRFVWRCTTITLRSTTSRASEAQHDSATDYHLELTPIFVITKHYRMSELGQPVPRFKDNGSASRENESFQGTLFSDLDFRGAHPPVSFFRSDFRQVKIEKVRFSRNNFDRADFIDAYIAQSSFERCNFGTDFINTCFDDVLFQENKEDTCTITQCIYSKCRFRMEKFINTTFRSCKFIECIFEECHFEMNTADDLSFDRCEFKNIDFSNMTATHFSFGHCRFEGLRVDPDYLGTYLFKGAAPEGLTYSYRGEDLHLGADYLESLETLMDFYAKSNRTYEAFNSAVLYNSFGKKGKSLRPIFHWALQSIAQEPAMRQTNSLLRMIAALVFYSDSDAIPLEDLFSMVQALTQLSLDKLSLTERLDVKSRITLLQELLKENLLSWNSSRLLDRDNVLFEVVLDEENQDAVETRMEALFGALQSSVGDPHYEILGTHRGSLVLECLASGAAVVAFVTCLRRASSNVIRIILEVQFSAKYLHLLKNAKTTEQVTKLHKCAANLLNPPSERALKTAGDLAGLIKEIRILGDSLDKTRE